MGRAGLLRPASPPARSASIWDALRAGAGDLPEGGAIADGGARTRAARWTRGRRGRTGRRGARPLLFLAAHDLRRPRGRPSPLNLTAHVNGTSTQRSIVRAPCHRRRLSWRGSRRARREVTRPPPAHSTSRPASTADHHRAPRCEWRARPTRSRSTSLRIALEKDTTSRGVAVRVNEAAGLVELRRARGGGERGLREHLQRRDRVSSP